MRPQRAIPLRFVTGWNVAVSLASIPAMVEPLEEFCASTSDGALGGQGVEVRVRQVESIAQHAARVLAEPGRGWQVRQR